MREKRFDNNDEYFNFLKKMDGKIEVINVEVGSKIKIQYRRLASKQNKKCTDGDKKCQKKK